MSIATVMLFNFLYYFLFAVEIAMYIRAVLSWIDPTANGMIASISYAISEPFVSVVRKLISKFSSANDSFFDVSFFITMFLISVFRIIISSALI